MSKTVTIRQRRLIASLLSTGNSSEAVREAGISRTTFYRWLRDPQFTAALREAESEALAEVQRRLLSLAEDAAGTLGDGLGAQSEVTRLRAADLILGRLLQLRELIDLDRRVSDLESEVQKWAD